MKVRLKTLMAGPEGVFHSGSVIDLPKEEAEALISKGYAEPFDQPYETAAFEPGNRTVRPVPRPRKTQ
jgi:hypothetical protein